ncbi:alpha/beta hydrolase [Nocardioides jensenii]|uniref:alpha/beta hydrolase n=1 Tax=Nocardioides jensenii TaxID=1843 RepID=UPI000831DA4E|nr:alpha/beta hydrolase [Nocardioides jensenii]
MPEILDPHVAQLLRLLNSAFPLLGTDVTDAAEARLLFNKLRKPVDQPTCVGEVHEIDVRGARDGKLAARLYRPRGPQADPKAAVLFFHGGGWVLGDLDSHDELVRQLCNSLGRTVVSVAYRLAPEHPFPEPLDDVIAAVQDLGERALQLDLHAPFVVSGDSAGGNLAALASLEARAREELPVAAQLLLYPVLDATCSTASYRDNAYGYYITVDHLRWFWDQFLGAQPLEDAATRCSPARWPDLREAPPAVIITAGLDPLRDEGRMYAEGLARGGCDVTLLNYPQAFHGFLGFAAQLPVAAEALTALGSALDRILGGTHGSE